MIKINIHWCFWQVILDKYALSRNLYDYTNDKEFPNVNTNSNFKDISVLKCTLMVSVVMCKILRFVYNRNHTVLRHSTTVCGHESLIKSGFWYLKVFWVSTFCMEPILLPLSWEKWLNLQVYLHLDRCKTFYIHLFFRLYSFIL